MSMTVLGRTWWHAGNTIQATMARVAAMVMCAVAFLAVIDARRLLINTGATLTTATPW